MVAQLLPALPRDNSYRVVFIERDMDEVLRSQKVMLGRLGKDTNKLDERLLRRTFETQVRRVKVWMAQQPNLYTLYLKHRDVLTDPAGAAERLRRFLGRGPDVQAMVAVVDLSLYRQRAAG